MKNEIQLLNINDVMSTAKIFAESGMFTDSKQMAQAFVKINRSRNGNQCIRINDRINIIMGKPTISAGLIAEVLLKGSSKYDYKVKEMTEKVCSVDFFQGRNLYRCQLYY